MLRQSGLGELVQENVDILATVTDMSNNLSFFLTQDLFLSSFSINKIVTGYRVSFELG